MSTEEEELEKRYNELQKRVEDLRAEHLERIREIRRNDMSAAESTAQRIKHHREELDEATDELVNGVQESFNLKPRPEEKRR